MKYTTYIKNLAILLSVLVISIPFLFAEEYSRTYDANGNLISDGKYYREYNGLNQLVRVRDGNTSTSPVLEEYRWHPVEERIIQKKVYYNGVLNYTVYYPNENFVQIVNSSGTFTEKYVYQDNVLVAQVNSDGQKQFIHSDNKGSNTLITALDGSVVENTFYSPYGEIIEGGKASRYSYEAKEYDSLTDDIDFKFRKYEPDILIFNQPDTLIQNVYDPQLLNRYAFERNNPYKYVDEDGHYAQYVLAGTVGFLAGSIGYMLTHSGSGWSHVRNTYAAGAVGAGTAVGGVAFATYAGTAVASKGAVAALSAAGKFLVGATGEATSEVLEGRELDTTDIIIAGGIDALFPGFKLKPGSKVGTKSLFTKNNLKLAGNYLAGFGAFSSYLGAKGYFSSQANQQQLYSQYQESNRQKIIEQRESGTYSGGSGYNSDAGAYVTDEGRVYPTNNPDWKPCGCSIN